MMKTAFIIFKQMTSLDLIGIYDPLTRLHSMGFMPDFNWKFCAFGKEMVVDDRGLRFQPDSIEEPLGGYDLIVVPGGFGTRALQNDPAFIDWLLTAEPVKMKASVCTGALLLGAAGFLSGKRATTHPNALDELSPYCSRVINQRVVDEGEIITAAGVTAAIDLGLYMVERLAGSDTKDAVAKQMDYPYRWTAHD